jgi:ParB-like chromosome segregation protein Spo0J
MLNFGARRVRASKIAGKSEIPVFVDETADSFDQVIENEQRCTVRWTWRCSSSASSTAA